MVIDDNDDLHAAYTTYTNWAERLVYMHYDGTNWTSEEVSSNANFGPVGIAVDSNNHPHISYAVEWRINAVMDYALPHTVGPVGHTTTLIVGTTVVVIQP